MILMPSCKEVHENLTEYMEGKLSFQRRMGIRVHLMMCKVCQGILNSLKALPRIAKDLLSAPPEPEPEAKEALSQVMARIKDSPKP